MDIREKLMQTREIPLLGRMLTTTAALGVGLGVGYILGKKTASVTVVPAEPDEDFAEKARAVEEHLDAIRQPVIMTPEEREAHSRLLEDYDSGISADAPRPTPPGPEHVGETVNVFAASDEDWNYEEELAQRSEDLPYVIHKDEFYQEELGFSQTTLTYYQGDDVLVDEEDQQINGYSGIIGELKFGHGSADERTFHVRNHKLHAEYEILLHDGTFASEVLGIIAEDELTRGDDLRHSARRFREE